jgi:hypothetical protein
VVLKEAGIDPVPERTSSTWADFLRSQADALPACDFFEGEVIADAHSRARPPRTMGANGWNGSRNFTPAFSRSTTPGSPGEARIGRFPSARGPASTRPWNRPTIMLLTAPGPVTVPTSDPEDLGALCGGRATVIKV